MKKFLIGLSVLILPFLVWAWSETVTLSGVKAGSGTAHLYMLNTVPDTSFSFTVGEQPSHVWVYISKLASDTIQANETVTLQGSNNNTDWKDIDTFTVPASNGDVAIHLTQTYKVLTAQPKMWRAITSAGTANDTVKIKVQLYFTNIYR